MPLIFFTTLAGITTLLDTTRTRLTKVRRDDRGASVVEWVFISGAAIVLAVLVLAAITAFVNGRIGKIS